jgi:uncharacterized protein (TIGR03083 family)
VSTVDVAEALWARWAAAGQTLGDDGWDRPTRLGAWTVRDLYAHVSRGVGHVEVFAGRVLLEPPTIAGPGAYYASYRPRQAAASANVDQKAREDAARCSTAELVDRFVTGGPRAAAAARRAGSATVETGVGAMLLLDYVATRVVEATVHLLDLSAALELGEAPPAEALDLTGSVLVSLCDPVALVEAATGRSTDPVFPVLV